MRLREERSARRPRLRPRDQDVASEGTRIDDLARGPWTRIRVDRQPLPGDSPDHGLTAERLAVPRYGQRPDDVAASSDPEDDRLTGVAQNRFEAVPGRDESV